VRTDCPPWAPPLLAIQFLTRVPVPGLASLSREAALDGLKRAVVWFPLVGTLIGLITAFTIVLAEQLWPRLVAVLLAFIIEARLTGAFHEDAVADFCDGVGGGRDPAHVREIMKDSRIGTYGALALVLALGLRLALTYLLPATTLFVAVVGAATFGRLLTVMVMASIAPICAPTTLAKDVGGRVSVVDVGWALSLGLPGLVPLAWVSPFAMLIAAIAGGMFILWFKRLLARRVGGSTGDCLGFVAYAGQLILLLAALST
jgi:adenosylcobinamide-GDP ribazoletransferase